jgi:hypothetical protein
MRGLDGLKHDIFRPEEKGIIVFKFASEGHPGLFASLS